MRAVLLSGLGCLLLNTSVLAMDGQHLARLAIETSKQNKVIQYAWIDPLSHLQFDAVNIVRADGAKLMPTPKIATSYNGVQYDVAGFYKKKPRINMVVHYAGRVPGEALSLGVDSGFSAKKIQLKPALFIGYTRALQLQENTYVALNANSWLGGGVSEQPCMDNYNREYYCPTLTAWSDYKPIENIDNFELNIVFQHNF